MHFNNFDANMVILKLLGAGLIWGVLLWVFL